MVGGFQAAVQPKTVAPIKPAAKRLPPKKMPPPPSALNKKKKQQHQQVMSLNKAKATTNSDADQLEGTTQKRCSWQAYVTEKMFNASIYICMIHDQPAKPTHTLNQNNAPPQN